MANATLGRALGLVLRVFPGTTIVPPSLFKMHVSSPIVLLQCIHPTCRKSMFLTPLRDSHNLPYHQVCKYESAGL